MEIGKFNISIKEGILIVTSKKNVTLDDLKEIQKSMVLTTGKDYNYGIYRDIIGYYDGYDFKNQISVYCGSMNENNSIKKIINYNEIKNSSS